MKFRDDAGVSIPASRRASLETPCQDPRVAHTRRVSGLSVVLGACCGSRPEYASGPSEVDPGGSLTPASDENDAAIWTGKGQVPWRGATRPLAWCDSRLFHRRYCISLVRSSCS